ncbi:hypothetical protein [Epilithonimonas sp.]|uniref:hypothetical protein n=1 Tax=Epilithonimonas sp. TaxID=2894511 RepID=UPI0035B24321
MKYITLIIFYCTALINAQVAIGKSAVSNPSVSLEFGNTYTITPVSNTQPKGLILPWVNGTSNAAPFITGSSASETVQNGTLVYDTNDKKVKVKYASGWKDLSVSTGTVNTALQDALSDLSGTKVSIGSTTSTPGILVLEDTNKAMVLPKVASPHINIINPDPGMIVYDAVKKQLVIYNGSYWTFWAAN